MKTIKRNQPFISMDGGVTAAQGFRAWGTASGIKISKTDDVGLVVSDTPASACAACTTNAVRAACVDRNNSLLPSASIRAILCNSGNANACTGKRGEKDTESSAGETGRRIGARANEVLTASTGVIGHFLPMDKLFNGIRACAESLSPAGGARFARAIMTTDTVPKEYAVQVKLSGGTAVIGGCVKGSGMICPNMATMLCFITSDVQISHVSFNRILKRVVGWTFNNLTVDGDMSTNDMVLAMANGMSGVPVHGTKDEDVFQAALFDVCNRLCAKIAEDGEGATKRIEINVTGGLTYDDCRKAAKAVANSNLVKTAIFGNDPNWGRILCAIGYSEARIDKKKLTVRLCGTTVFAHMRPAVFSAKTLSGKLKSKVVVVDINLGMNGTTCAVAHTCDLTYDYIKINAEYHT